MSNSDTNEGLTEDPEKSTGYLSAGTNRCMCANRISYHFDFKGPSFTLDSACSSSLTAVDVAMASMRNGKCDAAIVGGVNLCLKPQTSSDFTKLGMSNSEGKCKVFDKSCDGYVRSEAAVAIFLQKSSEAKRVYATIIHSKTNNDGYKEQGITYPSGEMQKQLLEEVYGEANVDPTTVEYLETHGTGTKVGDPQEVNNATDFFCKGRTGPLLVGSVKSNMGHSEAAAGMCGIAKVLIAIQEGVIPANLHYKTPNPDLPGLFDGRLKVVDKHTPWNYGLVGISSFGFGGANGHIVLRPNALEKLLPSQTVNEGLKLFTHSAQTEEGLKAVLDQMETKAHDRDLYTLLSDLATSPLNTHPHRGYCILNCSAPLNEITRRTSAQKRPIWFIYSGMGSQWNEMGRDLMTLDVFKRSIERADEILKPYNVSASQSILSKDKSTFDDIVNSFVAVASIQVALTNILNTLHIVPDGIIGHSVGELGCAYADSCFTEEQTILSAYWRGRLIKEANLPPGAMAAVGLTWEEAHRRCPEGVTPACHNAQENVTVSGAFQLVVDFMKELEVEGTFVRKVNTSGVPFHSYYMNDVAPALLKELQKLIPQPKTRSSKWISSSIPQSKWTSSLASTCSASYFVNNLVSPVLFHEALQLVPKNAVTIEVAPHTLMQSIIKMSVGSECTYVGLMKKNEPDEIKYFLSSLGRLYMNGINFKPADMYTPEPLPVSRGTQNIASLVKWDHSQSWSVATAENFLNRGGSSGKVQLLMEVDISSPESKDYYLTGHTIDGRILFPATGYLVLAWKAFARTKGQEYSKMKVVFEDVMFYRITILPRTGFVTFVVTVLPNGGHFEVSESDVIVTTGRIYEPEFDTLQYSQEDITLPIKAESLPLNSNDIYKELRLIGYEYGPTFQGILESDNLGIKGKLKWTGNWVTFLDTALQFFILSTSSRQMRLPTRLLYVHINPEIHYKVVNTSEQIEGDDETNTSKIPVVMDSVFGVCVSGGVEIKGLAATLGPRRIFQHSPPLLEEYHFVPFMENNCLKERENTEHLLKHYADLCADYIIQKTKSLLGQGIEVLSNSHLMSNISKGRRRVVDVQREVDIFLANTMLNPSLLKVLVTVFNTTANTDFRSNAYKIVKENLASLQEDSLLSALCHPRVLRTCLDLIQENISSSRINIVEAGASHGRMFSQLIPIVNSQLLNEIDYTVTDMDPQNLSSQELESFNVKSCKWDILGETAPGGADDADLVVAKGLLTFNSSQMDVCLNNITTSIKDGGFVLLLESTQDCLAAQFMDTICVNCSSPLTQSNLRKNFESQGLELVAEKSDGVLSTLFLLRKIRVATNNTTSVILIDHNRYDHWVEEVKQKMNALQEIRSHEVLWLVAHDSTSNGIVGMTNCLRREPGGDKIRCIFNPHLDSRQQTFFQDCPLQALRTVYSDILKKDLATNVYRDNCWGTYRHIPIKSSSETELVETENAYVSITTPGDLSTLRWMESPLKYHAFYDTKEPICDVYYSALNFKDVMLATANISADLFAAIQNDERNIIGMEYSGRDENGRRVMGFTHYLGMATKVIIKPECMWYVPDHWSLEEAATVPVVYSTVYYALIMRGNLRQGESILIHSGSGGVGQAAISLALSMGCEVYTTVGNKEKREFLKRIFPQLRDSNIASSRDTTFEPHIIKATNGKGVDVVLNSLSEEKLMASVRCLCPHGRFLEIGKRDLGNNAKLGMSIFLNDVSFHGVMLDRLLFGCEREKAEVKALVYQGIKTGTVKPLRRAIFGKDEIEKAFRYMASGKHIGKVMIKLREEEPQNVIKASPLSVPALRYTTCHPKKSYIIIGGLGGFGLELAQWLVDRGARHLVLTTRTGIRTGYQSRRLRLWKESNVNVLVLMNDVSTEDGTIRLMAEASVQVPVGGIFNLALVLRDALMAHQTVDNFRAVCDPKANGTHHLDQVSRKMCPQLDWFVAFSSFSCGRGNAGQANYGYGNSVMERICETRRKEGLPGLVIQWGVIGDVGAIIKDTHDNDSVVNGTIPQRIRSCMATMDRFLNQLLPVMSSFVMADKEKVPTGDVRKILNLLDAVSHILGVKDMGSFDPDVNLGELGMDSIMGVEIKNTLEREYDVVLSMNEIRHLSIKQLKAFMDAGGSSQVETNGKTDDLIGVQKYPLQNLVPTESIVHLNPVTNGKPLFIVHPIEGTTIVLESLANQLRCPVYGIQGTAQAPLGSVEELASFYIQQMKTVQSEGPYRLSGFSFGATVAIEMALQLEDANAVVENLILLDGSHKIIPNNLVDYFKTEHIKEFSHSEIDALSLFISYFVQTDYAMVKADIAKHPTWTGRLEHAANLLMKTGKFKDQKEIEMAADLFYKRILICCNYTPTRKLIAKVALIRARQKINAFDQIGNDYGLCEICRGQVNIHIVEGRHDTFLLGRNADQCASVIRIMLNC